MSYNLPTEQENTFIRKQYPGLDMLKFSLAIMIIATHTELGSYNPSVHRVLTNLFHIAVPCFFAISSFLFFRKIDSTPVNKQKSVFKKSITRYLILYLIWYILIFPFSWKIFIQPASGKEILFALLFKATDAGAYWFIKVLIINTCILFVFRSQKSLNLVTVVALMLFLFLAYNKIYHFASQYDFYFSFAQHLIYCALGAQLSRIPEQKFPKISFLILTYTVIFFAGLVPSLNPLYRLLSPLVVIPIFLKTPSQAQNNIYRILRHMSILFYMSHFTFIHIFNYAVDYFDLVYSNQDLVRFIAVFVSCFLLSLTILTLEKRKKLSFLIYTH